MYRVINTFKDLQDDGHVYKVGDTYPRGEDKPTKKRAEELASKHPTHKFAFIEEVKKPKKKE